MDTIRDKKKGKAKEELVTGNSGINEIKKLESSFIDFKRKVGFGNQKILHLIKPNIDHIDRLIWSDYERLDGE